MTKRSYMKAVIDGLRAVDSVDVSFVSSDGSTGNSIEYIPSTVQRKKIYVRLLLSIDRRETTTAAIETVCCLEST